MKENLDLQGYSPEMQEKIREMHKELKKFNDKKANVNKNLDTFDTLDFEVFSHQEWTRLHESHARDIKVNWPDGHSVYGIELHSQGRATLYYPAIIMKGRITNVS